MQAPVGAPLMTRLGITARLVLALTVASGVIFAVVFWVNYRYTAEMVERQVQAHARDVVQAAVQSIDDAVRGVVRDQKNLVAALERASRLTPEGVRSLARGHVAANDEVFGTTIAFEADRSPLDGKAFAPYYFKRLNNSIAYASLATLAYDYPNKDWYRQPKELKAPVWSEPYFDEGGGNVVMTTYSVPFYRQVKGGPRLFTGIATADVSIDWLGRQITGLRLYNNGYAALFSRKGVYLAHPDRALVLKETIFSVAERMDSLMLKEVGGAIGRGDSGFVKGRNIYGTESWIYYAPVPSTGWSLAVVFPAEAMLADAYKASRVIAFYCAGGFLLLLITIILTARTVTRPLVTMTGVVQQVAEGQLDLPLPVQAGGEVGQLAQAFVQMQQDLKSYIGRLTETTAAKERMASELAIAHDLQMAMLPHELPRRSALQLSALCRPAREVGGDFYDVRLLDEQRVFFIIGDVSGKGVPAALYMAITVSLARAVLQQEGISPAEALIRINNELSRGNDSCMFVTILCGILDIVSGELRYANAGHNPPVLLKVGQKPEFMELQPGLAAGCLDEYRYVEGHLDLAAGDLLLLYTDGVTEALNPDSAFFGEDQLLAAVAEGGPASGLADLLFDRVATFAAGAAQADDITILAICRTTS